MIYSLITLLVQIIRCQENLSCSAWNKCSYHSEEGILLESDMLQLISHRLTDYNNMAIPQIDKTLFVSADFFIQGLSAIDEVHMDYEFEIYFRQVTKKTV